MPGHQRPGTPLLAQPSAPATEVVLLQKEPPLRQQRLGEDTADSNRRCRPHPFQQRSRNELSPSFITFRSSRFFFWLLIRMQQRKYTTQQASFIKLEILINRDGKDAILGLSLGNNWVDFVLPDRQNMNKRTDRCLLQYVITLKRLAVVLGSYSG